jgi:hypothetical protein
MNKNVLRPTAVAVLAAATFMPVALRGQDNTAGSKASNAAVVQKADDYRVTISKNTKKGISYN